MSAIDHDDDQGPSELLQPAYNRGVANEAMERLVAKGLEGEEMEEQVASERDREGGEDVASGSAALCLTSDYMRTLKDTSPATYAYALAWRPRILASLRCVPSLRLAASRAGMRLDTVIRHADQDPVFKQAIIEARYASHDRMVEALYQRGVEGVDEPIVSGGVVIGTKRVYSDKLLIEGLRAFKPEQFDRQGRAAEAQAALAANKDAEAERRAIDNRVKALLGPLLGKVADARAGRPLQPLPKVVDIEAETLPPKR